MERGNIAALMILLSAAAAAPVQAGIFKCKQGTEIVYSDKPCPGAKVVDTTNGKRPQLGDYYAAQARALRDKIKLADAEQQKERDRNGFGGYAIGYYVIGEFGDSDSVKAWNAMCLSEMYDVTSVKHLL